MDAQQQYLFDLHGYVVLRGVLSEGQVAALNNACTAIENGVPDRLPDGVKLGKPVENGEVYLSNIAEGGALKWSDVVYDPNDSAVKVRATTAHGRSLTLRSATASG